MKILIIGGGPGGLYAGLLLKKEHPEFAIQIVERNPRDATYGWGVVFSDRTLRSFREADQKTYQQITDDFVLWQAIDIFYRDQLVRCGGHSFAGLSRRRLLQILQDRCLELGVGITFEKELGDLPERDAYDLVIAADGVNSFTRDAFAGVFRPNLSLGKAKFIWLGTDRLLDAFTFVFKENQHGLFQVHAYPFDGATSTFIVECAEDVWKRAGLDQVDEMGTIAYLEELFAGFLKGRRLRSNNSKWLNFVTVKNATWRHENVVLLGDAAHTAHFSIGSGTKLAMDGAIALATAFRQTEELDRALSEYEADRRPRVQLLQDAARQSRIYFENIKRYLHLEPTQFAFHLLTRSGRITYDNLRVRDAFYLDGVDGWYAAGETRSPLRIAPPPMFNQFQLRQLTLANRVATTPTPTYGASDGVIDEAYRERMVNAAGSGAALLLTEPVAVSADGRITPGCAGMYKAAHQKAWQKLVTTVHRDSEARIGLQLNHAGRRGATRPRQHGLDFPMTKGAWPVLAPSPLPFSHYSQVPRSMDRKEFDEVRRAYVHAAEMALEAGFDLLQLHCGHGYLLSTFLSPLTNQRGDEYGGDLAGRLAFPMEIVTAVRAVWPLEKPLVVALNATDWARGGWDVADAICAAGLMREKGVDLFEIVAGQTVDNDKPQYGAGYLTEFSDTIRHEAGVPTLIRGYLTTSGEINSILAAGRADLCLIEDNR